MDSTIAIQVANASMPSLENYKLFFLFSSIYNAVLGEIYNWQENQLYSSYKQKNLISY